MQIHFRTLSLTGLLLLTVCFAQAQDAKTIVAKTNAVYRNMKSLKISLQTTMTMDKQTGSSVKTEGQFIPGKKANILITPQQPAAGKGANGMGVKGAQVVDDGQTTYMIDVATHQYMKQPHNPNILPLMGLKYGLPLGGMDPTATNYKVLAPTSVNGVPCYTLQLSPPTKGATTTILLYIDKASYHLKQSKVTRSDGKRTMSSQTLVKSDAVNAPIPDSVFTYTPPKGAQEVKIPAPPKGK